MLTLTDCSGDLTVAQKGCCDVEVMEPIRVIRAAIQAICEALKVALQAAARRERAIVQE